MSSNYGDDFGLLDEDGQVPVVTFGREIDEDLYFGFQKFYRYGLDNRQREPLPGPTLAGNEFLSYMATDPVRGEITVMTSRWRMHFTRDDELIWQPIGWPTG